MNRRIPSHWRVLAEVAAVPAGLVLRGRDRGIAFTLTFDGLLEVPVNYGRVENDGLTHFVVTKAGRVAMSEHEARV